MMQIRFSFCAALCALMAGCGGGGSDTATAMQTPAQLAVLAQQVELGERLFNEVSISSAGNLACASCHSKDHAHADPAGTFLPLGGVSGNLQGLRSSPSLRYLNANLAFQFNRNGDPMGGFTWDGRADSRQAQARAPLFDSKEMANVSATSLADKLKALPYFTEFSAAFGLTATSTDDEHVNALTSALDVYQTNDPDYEPFSSKFDAVQAGTASFTAQEARGLAVFNNPQRGNCASCHSSQPDRNTGRILFTNFEYHALGVPRNSSVATQDATFFDLGLCGPQRTDLASRADLCGKFKVPTLRNIAQTAPYFHNAHISSLEDVVRFYATRDTQPQNWYPVVGGTPQIFNDLPSTYHGNVNRLAPFQPNANGTARLSPQDVADIVAFLRTLSDGFQP